MFWFRRPRPSAEIQGQTRCDCCQAEETLQVREPAAHRPVRDCLPGKIYKILFTCTGNQRIDRLILVVFFRSDHTSDVIK